MGKNHEKIELTNEATIFGKISFFALVVVLAMIQKE